MSSRVEEKAQRKAEREAAQAKKRAADQRRRRLTLLGGVALAAVVVVGIAVAVSQSGTEKPGGSADARTAAATVNGFSQSGLTLGDPKAPLTIEEFIDYQCPNCHEFNRQSFPTILDRYIRAGKVRVVLQTMAFLGEDSVTAARYGHAAAKQNRMWQFTEAFFATAGEENSGYVTDEFLRETAGAAGLDFDRLKRDAESDATATAVGKVDAQVKRLKVAGTPTLAMGRTGGATKVVEIADPFNPSAVSAAIDAQLKAIGETPPS